MSMDETSLGPKTLEEAAQRRQAVANLLEDIEADLARFEQENGLTEDAAHLITDSFRDVIEAVHVAMEFAATADALMTYEEADEDSSAEDAE